MESFYRIKALLVKEIRIYYHFVVKLILSNHFEFVVFSLEFEIVVR